MDWLVIFIRLFGLLMWALVLGRTYFNRHGGRVVVNRPQRIGATFVVVGYALIVALGGFFPGQDWLRTLATGVSAVSGIVGFIILVTPPLPATTAQDDAIEA